MLPLDGRNPRLVVLWFVVGFVVAVVAATLFLAAGSWLGYAPASAAVAAAVQGTIYVPRALRAVRRQRNELPGR